MTENRQQKPAPVDSDAAAQDSLVSGNANVAPEPFDPAKLRLNQSFGNRLGDPQPCLVPPDWSGGYISIFALQQEEKWKSAKTAAE